MSISQWSIILWWSLWWVIAWGRFSLIDVLVEASNWTMAFWIMFTRGINFVIVAVIDVRKVFNAFIWCISSLLYSILSMRWEKKRRKEPLLRSSVSDERKVSCCWSRCCSSPRRYRWRSPLSLLLLWILTTKRGRMRTSSLFRIDKEDDGLVRVALLLTRGSGNNSRCSIGEFLLCDSSSSSRTHGVDASFGQHGRRQRRRRSRCHS